MFQPQKSAKIPAILPPVSRKILLTAGRISYKTVSTSHVNEMILTRADNAPSVGRRQAHQNVHISHLRVFQVKIFVIFEFSLGLILS